MSLESIADSIKLLATVAGIISIAYAGLMLITSKDAYARSQWKEVIMGVVIGICIVYLAPVISSMLSGGHYCG
ncbi:MAG: TrbC/VirB2 family protein [Candidatus Micrarchaeota archaeon]|nr:pilin [Candidatus Micrarchaeota archaeon]